MSTTTAADLINRSHALVRDLRRSGPPPTRQEWDAFDDTIHRLLTNLLGPHGRNIPMRSERRAQLIQTLQTYPAPLRDSALAATPTLRTLRPVASPDASAAAIRRRLHAVRDDDLSVPAVPDLDLPSATDQRPTARLTCTLGALADLLVDAPHHALTTDRGDLADATARVLTVAAVAARHALSVGDLDHGDRALAVGRWAEHCLDRLGQRSVTSAALDRVAATHPDRGATGINDRLEAARTDWTAVAQAEVGKVIPSVDVLRVIANQGSHLYGLTAHLLQDHRDLVSDSDAVTPQLAKAAQALRVADQEWAGLTTLSPPSHEFLTESRRLLAVLNEVGAQANSAPSESLDRQRAMSDLVALGGTIADLTAATRNLPRQLRRSGLLSAPPARALDPLQRLNHRSGQGAAPLSNNAAPDLQTRWSEAALATAAAAQVTGELLQGHAWVRPRILSI